MSVTDIQTDGQTFYTRCWASLSRAEKNSSVCWFTRYFTPT